MSYASILRELKKRVNPDELGATVQGIRETRSKNLLVELKCSENDRGPEMEFRITLRHPLGVTERRTCFSGGSPQEEAMK